MYYHDYAAAILHLEILLDSGTLTPEEQREYLYQAGIAYRAEGQMAQAHDRIYQGLALRKKNGQRGREAFSINALGMLQRDEGHLDKARVSFNEAYNIWKTLRAEVDMAFVSRNLGWWCWCGCTRRWSR